MIFDYLTGYAAKAERSGLPAVLETVRDENDLAGAAKLVRRQQGVHRTGTEPFQIESYELEAQSFEDRGELRCHAWAQGAFQFFPSNLDADDVAVMPHPKLPEPEGSNRIFATLDYLECFSRYGAAILDAR